MKKTEDRKDLDALPEGTTIPPRPHVTQHGKEFSNVIGVAKKDFDYIAERNFKGRFAITNRRGMAYTHSERIARIVEWAKLTGTTPAICIAQAKSTGTTKTGKSAPDGATWRTVEVVSAFKADDGKLVVIEIMPPKTGKEARDVAR